MRGIKKAFIFVIFLLIFFSCYAFLTPDSVSPLCRHRAIYCAITYGDLRHVPVRIAYGRVYVDGKLTNVYHAQAQAYVNGKWHWLRDDGERVFITDHKPSWFKVEGYVSPLKAMILWIDISNKGGKDACSDK